MKSMPIGRGLGEGICFLHLADLRFARPLPLESDMPPRLRDILLNAKRLALAGALDIARKRGAQFVLLVGDILGAKRYPPGLLWTLLQDLESAASDEMPVLWCFEEGQWPTWADLPAGVKLLTRPVKLVPNRSAPPVVLVPLRSWAKERESSEQDGTSKEEARPTGPVRIVVGCSRDVDKIQALLEQRPAAYWALGGRERHTIAHGRQIAHFPGPIQGDRLAHVGPHYATLVHLAPGGPPRLEAVATDRVRFARVHLDLREMSDDSLGEELVAAQIRRLRKAWPEPPLLLTWVVHVTPNSRLGPGWAQFDWAERWRRKLNSLWSTHDPPIWSLEFIVCPHGFTGHDRGKSFNELVLNELTSPGVWQQATEELDRRAHRFPSGSRALRVLQALSGKEASRKLLVDHAVWHAWQLLSAGGEEA